MNRSGISRAWSFLIVLALLAMAGRPAQAELIYAAIRGPAGPPNIAHHLITFDSATPGTVTDLGAITNLGPFQYLEDIDFRPATGQLYGLGYTGSVYNINLGTLVATSAGFPGAPGTGYAQAGIDFDPVADRLRIIDGQTGFNALFNPNTGTGAPESLSVDYALGDSNAGANPRIAGIAYNNNVNGALTTTLFGIDIHQPQVSPPSAILTTIIPASAGTLHTVGNLGVSTTDLGGFDISGGTGIAYAALNNGSTSSTLYTINLSTGAATPVGIIGIDYTQFQVAGISVAPPAGPGGGGNVPIPPAILLAPLGALFAAIASRRFKSRTTSI
jgi:hypothetical protein